MNNLNINEFDLKHYKNVFKAISDRDNQIVKNDIILALENSGIEKNDIRIKNLLKKLNKISEIKKINFDEFIEIVSENINLIEKSITRNFIIPDFQSFKKEIEEIYFEVKENKSGKNADYIPQLARVDSDLFAVAFCSVDGQILNFGDYDYQYCAQSSAKTINYCIATELLGQEKVHQHVGREPSGVTFNAIALNKRQLPHNPMINAGAIMICSLIKADLSLADKFEYIAKIWADLGAGEKIRFDNAVYNSEKETANRNYALAHYMKEVGAFPDETNIDDVLDFYFQCCSIEVNARQAARIMSTIANGGICPLTNKKIFSPETVRNCLSLMYSCGMYDFSGEYAFTVGLPAKSGVSGALMIVVPNVGGFAVFSPRLDEKHNSVRGVEFSKKLVEKFNFHNYDQIANHNKIDPTKHYNENKNDIILNFIWSASQGDINEVKRYIALGVDVNQGDYDKRTALHLAAAEGNKEVAIYLILKGANINAQDRWGMKPINDAKANNHQEIIAILEGTKINA